MKAGGRFVIETVGSVPIFTPEKFSEEQKEIAKLTETFAVEQILKNKKQIEQLDEDLTRQLIKKAGALGLLAVDVPEEFEGLGMDKVTSALINEKIALGQTPSFTVTFSAHTGIGTLPIVLFGNNNQKAKYLPKLASGDWICAYALTEPGSGSDALAAKTTAVLSPDKKYFVLNGSKQFITNGGWCELAIVYAKVDSELFTAFLVEMESPGVERGSEENKMGLKGSSTTALNFSNVKIPVENVLGEIGKGHHIAFNILNIGRYKLGAAVLGSCKVCVNEALQYAAERKQFNQPIAEFDAIKSKFANMVTRTFELESILYRTVGDIDDSMQMIDKNSNDYQQKMIETLETFATEASICKVFGSEALWLNSDDGLQIFGGYGFTEDYPLASIVRDTRVDRIYEGTNEINRQIIANHFVKKMISGELAISDKLEQIPKYISGEIAMDEDSMLKNEMKALEYGKMIALYLMNVSLNRFGKDFKKEQQLQEVIANNFIDLYVIDSTLTRILQINNLAQNDPRLLIGTICTMEKMRKIVRDTKIALLSILESDQLDDALTILTQLSKYTELRLNLFRSKRRLAESLYEKGRYDF